MVDGALRSGVAEHRAVFEVFARDLRGRRRYGVVAGLGRLLAALPRFRFGDEELAFLRTAEVVSEEAVDHLAGYRFTGDVTAYREGELYVPGSPVLTVAGRFADVVVLETLVLSILNHDSAIATAAARMRSAAGDRTLLEFGGRRTHELAAVDAARAAYVAGFDATSNLEAGRSYAIPTSGTVAHAFVQAHESEKDAYAAQIAALGPSTTVLVDTYDIAQGIRLAVEAAQEAGAKGPGAVRIDSGDLAAETERARDLLDELGATETRIVLSGDLEEHRIAELADVPADGYGVGTQLVTGSGQPTVGFVYKLVAAAERQGDDAPLVARRKTSEGKATVAGRKTAWRALDGDGHATAERIAVGDDGGVTEDEAGTRSLQVPVMVAGEVVHAPSLDVVVAHHARVRSELPPAALDLSPGGPAWPTEYVEAG
jgi:nicotinate phosphoribosyltransferase